MPVLREAIFIAIAVAQLIYKRALPQPRDIEQENFFFFSRVFGVDALRPKNYIPILK
jgi:hypothetical protein